MPETERAAILRAETHCDDPRAPDTIGIVAYQVDQPVPRDAPRLLKRISKRSPKTDP